MTVNERSYLCGFLGISLVAAMSLLCETGCKSTAAASAVSASEEAQAHPDPPAVTANADSPAPVSAAAFTAYGPLVADQQADLAAQRDGRVTSVAIGIGDQVHAGQLMAQMDDSLLQAQFAAQKARVAAAQAQVREWQASQQSAVADLQRADALHDAKILSDEDWEVAKYKVDETNAEVERYKSEQAAAEAELNATQVALDQSRIMAPFNGVVGRVSARANQQVKQGDILFWVTAEAPLRVLFTAPESAMRRLGVGRSLDLTTADYPGLHQAGHVLRVSPVVDPASASIQVIGAVDRPSPLLKPGMSMQVRLAP